MRSYSYPHDQRLYQPKDYTSATKSLPGNPQETTPGQEWNKNCMERFLVQGGRSLEGTLMPAGNKNEALPVLAASLLCDAPIVLQNLPRIHDIVDMIRLLEHLGAKIESHEDGTLRVHADALRHDELEFHRASRIRGSVLLAAPLLARMGSVSLPIPGGDRIGIRRLGSHLLALEQLGARQAPSEPGRLRFVLPGGRFRGTRLFMDEASVTATENAVMAAATAQGATCIENAACEPHVQGLCRMLQRMGAHIEGIGTNRLEIQGVERLGTCSHRVQADLIEIGSFIALAAATRSALRIRNVDLEPLRMIRMVFQRLGVDTKVEHPNADETQLFVPAQQSLEIRSAPREGMTKVDSGTWPAFPSDLLSIVTVLATQCHGSLLIFEKLFENRLFWVDRLISMGARIVLCDVHRAVVSGPAALTGTLINTPDIRAGMALLIAALCAQGESEIQNVHQIDRGYEAIDQRLNALGAEIRRVRDADEDSP